MRFMFNNRDLIPSDNGDKNLVISSRSCAVTAKNCTKKRDARAELLFCSLNLLVF